MAIRPFRSLWENDFPNVWIHAEELTVKRHPAYTAAKAGDIDAALELVTAMIDEDTVARLDEFGEGKQPILVSVHAEEAVGVNAIPEALTDVLCSVLQWEREPAVIQANIVNHTGAGGFNRLARQAIFEGEIIPGRNYLIVDDFVGQGGTIANLRGHVLRQGGSVIGATVLTGKPYSAILALSSERLTELREKHGQLENWRQERFAFGFDCLTASEARYLVKTEDTERIRTQIMEAGG